MDAYRSLGIQISLIDEASDAVRDIVEYINQLCAQPFVVEFQTDLGSLDDIDSMFKAMNEAMDDSQRQMEEVSRTTEDLGRNLEDAAQKGQSAFDQLTGSMTELQAVVSVLASQQMFGIGSRAINEAYKYEEELMNIQSLFTSERFVNALPGEVEGMGQEIVNYVKNYPGGQKYEAAAWSMAMAQRGYTRPEQFETTIKALDALETSYSQGMLESVGLGDPVQLLDMLTRFSTGKMQFTGTRGAYLLKMKETLTAMGAGEMFATGALEKRAADISARPGFEGMPQDQLQKFAQQELITEAIVKLGEHATKNQSEWRKNLDAWNDTVEESKQTIGTTLLPMATQLLKFANAVLQFANSVPGLVPAIALLVGFSAALWSLKGVLMLIGPLFHPLTALAGMLMGGGGAAVVGGGALGGTAMNAGFAVGTAASGGGLTGALAGGLAALGGPLTIALALVAVLGLLAYRYGILQEAWARFGKSEIGKDIFAALAWGVEQAKLLVQVLDIVVGTVLRSYFGAWSQIFGTIDKAYGAAKQGDWGQVVTTLIGDDRSTALLRNIYDTLKKYYDVFVSWSIRFLSLWELMRSGEWVSQLAEGIKNWTKDRLTGVQDWMKEKGIIRPDEDFYKPIPDTFLRKWLVGFFDDLEKFKKDYDAEVEKRFNEVIPNPLLDGLKSKIGDFKTSIEAFLNNDPLGGLRKAIEGFVNWLKDKFGWLFGGGKEEGTPEEQAAALGLSNYGTQENPLWGVETGEKYPTIQAAIDHYKKIKSGANKDEEGLSPFGNWKNEMAENVLPTDKETGKPSWNPRDWDWSQGQLVKDLKRLGRKIPREEGTFFGNLKESIFEPEKIDKKIEKQFGMPITSYSMDEAGYLFGFGAAGKVFQGLKTAKMMVDFGKSIDKEPKLQHGGEVIETGRAVVDRGEMVIPASINQLLKSTNKSPTSSQSNLFNFNINVTGGATDKDAQRIVKAIDKYMNSEKMKKFIKDLSGTGYHRANRHYTG